jgi:hypothetical protein
MADQTDTATPRIANTERLRWQRDAAAILAKLLELAARRGLPVISWTVADTGARLVGHCYSHPAEGRRADFTAWRDALGEPDTDREHTASDGTVRLVAVWDRGGSGGKGLRPLLSDKDGYQRAGVVLSAEILPDSDDEDSATDEVAR